MFNITLFRVLVILAVIGVGGGFWMAFVDTKPRPVLPPPVEPSYSPYKNYISGSGIIESQSENIKVGSYLAGIVQDVFVKVNDNVKKGDKLYSLDQRQLNAEIEIKRKQIEQEKANLAQSKISLKDAEDKFNLVKAYSDSGALSKEEYIIRRNNIMLAEAAVKSNQTKLATSEASLKAALLDLNLLTICAPIDCKILQINVHPGEYIGLTSPSTPYILVGSTEKHHIRVDIDETDAWRFQPNMPATAYLRGNNNLKIDLTYHHLEPYIIPKKNLTGATTERIDIRVLQPLFSYDPEKFKGYIGQQVDVYIQVPDALS